MQTSNKVGTDPIYDARTLGTPRMLVLGVQHMFAMFGATVLVPARWTLPPCGKPLGSACPSIWKTPCSP